MSNQELNPVYGDNEKSKVEHKVFAPMNSEGTDGKLTDTPKNNEALQETAYLVFVFPKTETGEGRRQKYLNTTMQCQNLALAILEMLSGTEREESVKRLNSCVQAKLTRSEIGRLTEQAKIDFKLYTDA